MQGQRDYSKPILLSDSQLKENDAKLLIKYQISMIFCKQGQNVLYDRFKLQQDSFLYIVLYQNLIHC